MFICIFPYPKFAFVLLGKKKMWELCWHYLVLCFHLQVICSSSFNSSSPLQKLCSSEQSSALLRFKNTFSNDKSSSFSKTNSWKEGSDCCTWDGVSCDRFTGHVIGLDLSSCGLIGPINDNSSLFHLHHLQKLNLARNNFLKSNISSKFGQFMKLRHLNLSSSSFCGLVPTEIFHLSKLVLLDLSSYFTILELRQHDFNKLLQNLTELRYLHLEYVNMSSVAIGSFVNLSSSLISLSLQSNYMQGKFPNELFRFPFLQLLRLSDNQNITGKLPNFNRSNPLKLLDLSFTKFSGKIPDTISNLMHLNHLRLGGCKFKGSFPPSLENLTDITFLDLSSNDFTGQIPTSISKLGQLTDLNLRDNIFSGPFPDVFGNLSKLTGIDLSSNYLNSQLPTSFFNLKQLFSLDFSDNQLEGHLPSQASGPSNLELVSLGHNLLSGRIPSWLFTLPSLATLNLSHNLLTSFEYFPQMENLDKLDLSFNLLQGQLMLLPTSITFVSVSNNNLTGVIPPSFCNLSSILYIDLSNNSFSGKFPPCLGNCSMSLFILNLEMNNFHGSLGSLTFPNPCSLTALMLNGNQLEGPLPRSLINCATLEILDVGNNMIKDTFPNWVETLEILRVIILRSNRFHGPIDNSSAKYLFPGLRILDLSHNQFTGPLPINYFNNFVAMMPLSMDDVKVGYMGSYYGLYFYGLYYSVTLSIKGVMMEMNRILTILTAIDLSNNLFRGPIPAVIGKLESLKLLNLSHNSLTGDIPSSLGNLTQLESLDLSYNKLLGNIPMQLTSLTFLSVLNLSYNQLVGPIPQGKQFDAFPNESFIGNLGLCGSTLSKKCGNDKASTPTPSIVLKEIYASSWFDWKIALMGYGCGLVLGISIGYIVFSTRRPLWFVRLIDRRTPRNVRRLNRGHRGRRNL